MDERTQEQIRDYIRQYRDVYTREAIDHQLLGAGYTREEIAEGWSSLEGGASPGAVPGLEAAQAWRPYEGSGERPEVGAAPEQPLGSVIPTPPRQRSWDSGSDLAPASTRRGRVERGPVFWRTIILFILGSYVLFALFGSGFLFNIGFGGVGTWGCLLLIVSQAVGLIVGINMLNKNRQVAHGLLYGVLMTSVVIPAVLLLLGLGICLVFSISPAF